MNYTHTEWRLFSANVRKVISVFDLEGENGEKIGIGIENIGAVNLVPVKEATTLDELYRRTQSA